MNCIIKIYTFLNCALLLSTTAFSIDLPNDYVQETFQNSKSLLNEKEVINHLQESQEKNENPVVLAIKKDNLELAELLLMIRRIEITLDIQTFEFPGYKFNRPYGELEEEAIVWVKKTPITLLNHTWTITDSYTDSVAAKTAVDTSFNILNIHKIFLSMDGGHA